MRKLVLALGVPLFALAVPASAHFNLTMPQSIAKSTEGGKGVAPCGPDTGTTGMITEVTGGSLLTLHIDETVPHPGFYRFALSMTSPPTFPADNVVRDKNGMVLAITSNGLSDSADFEDPAKYPVLADHLFVHDGSSVQSFPSPNNPGQVTVPNVNCDKCTLQVIEFMSNHGSNSVDNGKTPVGFFYHHCAFLKITADPNKPIFDPSATGGSGGTSSGGSSGAAGSSGAPSAGAAGTVTGGTGGAAGAAGAAGGAVSAGAPSSAGAGAQSSAAGASAAGASSAGAAAQPTGGGSDESDSGGCSLSKRSASSAPLLSVLIGLFVLGRRRRSRRVS